MNPYASRLIYSYLSNHTSIGVPQGSVIGPSLLTVCLNDLFYRDLESEICNFADDTTVYSCNTNIDSVTIKLERDLQGLLELYTVNGISGNLSKFQIMFLSLKSCLFSYSFSFGSVRFDSGERTWIALPNGTVQVVLV